MFIGADHISWCCFGKNRQKCKPVLLLHKCPIAKLSPLRHERKAHHKGQVQPCLSHLHRLLFFSLLIRPSHQKDGFPASTYTSFYHNHTQTYQYSARKKKKNVTSHPNDHIILTHQISDKLDRTLYRWHLFRCVHCIVHSIQYPGVLQSLKSLFLPPSLQINNFLEQTGLWQQKTLQDCTPT